MKFLFVGLFFLCIQLITIITVSHLKFHKTHKKGIIHHQFSKYSKSLQKNNHFFKKNAKNSNSFKKFRFNEINTQTSNNFFNEIPFINSSANSTYIVSNIIHSSNNAINDNYGYWCSAGNHNPLDIVYWQGDISNIQGFTHIMIKWAYAPGFYSVQVSNNGVNFREVLPWKACFNGDTYNMWKNDFFQYSKNKSFSELLTFPEKIYARNIRILMKKPVFDFFGIYEIKLLERKTDVLIRTKIDGEDMCLVQALEMKENALGLNCFDAISFFNGSELFRITKDFRIQSTTEQKCLNFIENQEKVIFSTCDSSNPLNKWQILYNESYIALSTNNMKKCLKLDSEFLFLTKFDIKATSTSTMNDDHHQSINPLLENSELTWISNPGDSNVRYIIRFIEMPIFQIKIKWIYKPKKFIIQAFFNDFYWKNLLNITNNDNYETILNINEFITGIKVILIDGDELFNEKIVFGIENFRILTKFRKIITFSCENKLNEAGNQWNIETVDSNLKDQNSLKNLKSDENSLYVNSEKLEKLIQELKETPEALEGFLLKAKKIKAKTEKIINFYFKTNQKIDTFKAKNLEKKELELNERLVFSSIGSTNMKPGEDCLSIKKLFPLKRSGYYWIQPSCSLSPIRVFCDFQENLPQDYYFLRNTLQNPLKTLKDIEKSCSYYGLEPLDLNSKQQYQRIKVFLNDMDVLTDMNEMIPIAFDSSCFSDKCTGHYVSLNSKNSDDLFNNLLKSTYKFYRSSQKSNDFLSITRDYIIPFNLETSKVKGILCSTNNNNRMDMNDWISIGCDTIARYNDDFRNKNVHYKVQCPSKCLKYKQKYKVWGTDYYKDDSSICLAAIHNRKLDAEKGGFISIEIIDSDVNYKGTKRNGVLSIDWDMTWDKYIIIESYKQKCPIDKFKNEDLLKNSLNFVEINDLYDIDDNEDNDEKEKRSKMIESMFYKKKEQLNYFLNISKKAENLLENLQNELNKAEFDKLFPQFQEEYISKNENLFAQIENNFNYLDKLAKQKLNEKIKKKASILKEISLYSKISNFDENYSNNFNENWEISMEKSSFNNVSHQWSYKLQNLFNHSSLLECIQTEESTSSSLLLLKNKKYYDGTITLSFLSKGYGIIGIAFRYQNAFNCYILEISRSNELSENFKRVLKIKDGLTSEIFKSYDGGFLENVWYDVSIKFQRENFEIQINTEQNRMNLPIKYMIYDGDLVYGTMALVVRNIKKVYFDNIAVNTLECLKEENGSGIIYESHGCSRFKDNYKAEFNYVWKKIDPIDSKDGPSHWSYSDYHEKQKVILQNSLIKGRQIYQEPAILELKIDKNCQEGVIKTKILLKDNGYAGLAFKYKDSRNYYSLELHLSDESPLCRVRKAENGFPQLILENIEECSQLIQKDQWIDMIIQMKNKIIKCYIIEYGITHKIFDIPDDIHNDNDRIALISYGTIAGFTDFQMMPNEDYEINFQKNDENQEIYEKTTSKRFLYENCMKTNKEDREKYCNRKFVNNPYKISLCKKEFCSICCKNENYKKKECENVCQAIFFVESKDSWKNCQENEIKTSKSFKDCDDGFITFTEKQKCKLDLCNLCCIKGKYAYSEESNGKCKATCFEKYSQF